MINIAVKGWRPGFQKIPFTKLLQSLGGLSLASAKQKTDQVLEGLNVSITIGTMEDAQKFLDAAQKMGAIAGIVTVARTGTHG